MSDGNCEGLRLGSVFIALPAFGNQNCSQTTASLMALAKVLLASGYDYYFNQQSYPDIAELRNMMLTIWYDKTEAEHILFIDADMSFEPELVMDMLAFGESVVGVAYPARTLPPKFVVEHLPGKMEVRNGFGRVKDIGAGVLLIRRDAVTDMLERHVATSDDRLSRHSSGQLLLSLGVNRIIRAFDQIETETGELSEDKSFCARHRQCGGSIWANISHPISHIGQFAFTGSYLGMIEGNRPARAEANS